MNDHRVLVVQFEKDAGPARMGEWLIDAGCELDVRRAEDAPDLEDHDALVVLGGSAGANDDDPGVEHARGLVVRAARAGVPTLGICLGHQVCTVALGGTVEPNPRGSQLGLTQIGWLDAASTDPLTAGLADVRRGVHWNNDIVTALPEGATLLASTAAGEVQAARLAPAVWGVQWHPEVDDEAILPWAEFDRANHPPGRVDDVVDEVRAARTELEQGWRGLGIAFTARISAPDD